MADTKIKDLTPKTPVLADQIIINDVTDNSDGVVTFAQIETIFSASADTIGGQKTYTTGPILNDAVKLAFGTTSESTIVDTGSGMLIDIDEQNAGSKSLVIESDSTALLTINDTSITSSVFLDVPDIETATVSARDGSLCATIADSTGIATFVTGTVLVAPVLGTPASGALTNCTSVPVNQGTGILPDASMPNLTGDVTTSEGAVATTIGAAKVLLSMIATAAKSESLIIPASDNTTALTTGIKFTFYMPYAMTLTDIKASVLTAPTDATLIVDVHEAGTTIMSSDKLEIETTELHTKDATDQPVLSDTTLANNAKIEIEIDQIGSSVAGAGLVVYLIGYQT